MISDKREEDKKREAQETAFVNGQSPESVKKNPNPRANENLPDKEGSEGEDDKDDTTGAGSEITDGEDG
jgi:hypothetical protein